MIAIIDYGVGNLKSVEKAFEFIGTKAIITSDPEEILSSDAVVLPGVGAFKDAMDSLLKYGLVDTVKKAAASGKPFLGICLGMQLLFDYSEEGGEKVDGLGLFRGSVRQLPCDMNLKVPHMGWNSLELSESSKLLEGLPEVPYVYFVHSYFLDADNKDSVIAKTNYGIKFDVAYSSGNVFATQFHPEKSGETGLRILKNFIGLIGGN